jgi:methyl-accepting chemotaxis protein
LQQRNCNECLSSGRYVECEVEDSLMTEWPIRKKLLLCFGLTFLCTAAGVGVAVYTIRSLRASVDGDLRPAMRKLDAANQISTEMSNMRAALRAVTIYSLTGSLERVRTDTAYQKANSNAIKQLNSLDGEPLTGAERASLANLRSGLEQWKQLYEEAAALCAAGKGLEADAFGLSRIRPVIEKMQAEGTSFSRQQREAADAALAAETSLAASGTAIVLGVGVLCLGLAVLVFFTVNGVTQALRRIASAVADEAHHVASAAQVIESSSQGLAQGSSEQAGSIEETSASCQEIGTISHKNGDLTRTASSVAVASAKKHEAAEKLVAAMETSMREIQAASGRVSHVLKVVDEIAFQTNILALNAAVEAARAGEAGLGFAVVAGEVRNLAQKCAAAAQETSGLIEQSISMSADGAGKARSVSEAIRGLMEDASKVQTLVNQIEMASQQQTTGTEQIAGALTQIEQVTQRIASQAEESAASSVELSEQSALLNNAVVELKAMAS